MPREPATPDLVELVRSFAELAPNDLDAMLRHFAADAIWEATPLGTTYHGREEIRGFLTDWMGSYDAYEIEPQDIRDVGNGVVLALVHQLVRPVGGAADTRMREPWAFVFVWREGSIARAVADQRFDKAIATAQRLAEERASGPD